MPIKNYNAIIEKTFESLTVEFDIPCIPSDLEKFRKKIAKLGNTYSPLFHNHDYSGNESKLNYDYPLINYRSYQNKPYIYAINKGREALEALLASGDIQAEYRKEDIEIKIDRIPKENQSLQLFAPEGKNMFRYRIKHYVPFNNANYDIYVNLPTFLNKVAFLEKMLTLHLSTMANALGWKWNKNKHQIVAIIDDIDRIEKITLHDNNFIAIDLVFYTNALLPDRIAIGNDLAFGKGWLHKQPKKIAL